MESLDEARKKLQQVPDPLALLAGLFTHSPVAYQIYAADGHSVFTNKAFRQLFGSEPPPDFNIFRDEVSERTGILSIIRRAFLGETVETPPVWYDPREIQHVKVTEGRQIAMSGTFFPLQNAAGEVTHVGIAFKDLTEEMRAREAAEAERDLLRLIVEQSGDGVVVADDQGVVRLFNAEAQRLYGVPKQEVSTSEWTQAYCLETMEGESLPFDQTAFFRALRGERVESARWRVRLADGTVRYLSGTASPLRRGNGTFAGAVLTVHDETSRIEMLALEQRARRDAEKAAALVDAFLDGAPVQIGIIDADLRYLKVNAALAAVNGRSVEEHVGRSIYEVVPKSAAALEPVLRQVLETGKPLLNMHGVTEAPAAPGVPVHCLASFFPVELPGVPHRMVGGAFVEITDQVKVQEAVENQQRWLEAVLNLMPTPVVMVEPSTKCVTFANEAASELNSRLLPEKLPSSDVGSLIHVEDATRRRLSMEELPLARAARGEALDQEEVVWQTPQGDLHLLVSARQLPAMYGHDATVVSPFLDITRMKTVERELKLAVRARDEFLSIASHELKTPLTSLKLQLQSTRRNIEFGREHVLTLDRLHRFVEQSEQQVDRLTRLVDDMLDVSRIATGKLTIQREPVDLVVLLREVIERLTPQIEQVKCTISLEAPEAIVGLWDRFRLEQVVINLLTNAARYAPGKPIEIRARQQKGIAALSIRDYGRGIAPADQERVFQQFERAVPSREISGLGLGLYITKQIVMMHHGEIRVESRVGEGALFTVTLPLEPPAGEG